MATNVEGETYRNLDGKLFEIKRQLRQINGYPFDLEKLSLCLQDLIEGNFGVDQLSVALSLNRFKVSETNLINAVSDAERFTESILGIKVDLNKMFTLPEELPWENVFVVFDPGTMTDNFDVINKVLRSQNLNPALKCDLTQFYGFEAQGLPSLSIIKNEIFSDSNTKNRNIDELLLRSKSWLTFRGYVLAFGAAYFSERKHLDWGESTTCFPNDCSKSNNRLQAAWQISTREKGQSIEFDGDFRVEHRPCVFKNSSMGARMVIPAQFVG